MRDKLLVWFQAARPFTLSASVTPVLVGSALAFREGQFSFLLFVLVMAASLLVQAGANLVDEFSDDARPESNHKLPAFYKVIARGLLSRRAVKLGAAVCFGVATIIGLYLIFVAGWPILVISITSAAVAYFYAGGSKPLGAIGLGHIMVFIFMGPVMVLGTYYVQTQAFATEVILLSIPVGCTVTAILVANDLRDIDEDKAAGKMTPVTRFGRRFGQWEWTLLVTIPFLIVIALVVTKGKGFLSLLTLLAIFQMMRTARVIWQATVRTEIAPALPGSTKLHGLFGLLLSAGVALSRYTTL